MKLPNWLSTKMSAAIVLLLLVVALAVSSTGYAATYTGVQNVSADGPQSLLPRAAQAPDGDLHVVWDTNEGGRKVRWRKGEWNGSTYVFGPSVVIADVGGFQYSTPHIAVAPNGTVLATWSSGFQIFGRSWNMNDAQPGGTPFQIMPGFDSSIASDSKSNFHIVANGDFQVQYCELIGRGCVKREAFSRDLNATPDIAVDGNNGVHLIWAGQGVRYRMRAAGGEFSTIERLSTGGNATQIAADGKGSVHIVWSQDYDIQYCRKSVTQPNTGCAERYKGDAAEDLSPSIGATRGGNLLFAFYDQGFKSFWTNTREDNVWEPSREIAAGPTRPDLTSKSYTNRISAVWSLNYDIVVLTTVLKENSCDRPLGAGLMAGLDVAPQAIPANGLYLPVIWGGPLPTTSPTPTPGPQC